MTRKVKLVIVISIVSLLALTIGTIVAFVQLQTNVDKLYAVNQKLVYNLTSKLAYEKCQEYQTDVSLCKDMDAIIDSAECVGDCWIAQYSTKEDSSSRFLISVWVKWNGEKYQIEYYYDSAHSEQQKYIQ